MKRVVIVLIAALAAGCLLQGCAKTVTTPDDAGTGHSPAQTAAAPDDAVYAYSLGVCIEAEQGAELSALHNEYMQGTGVKQIVCRTEFSAGMILSALPQLPGSKRRSAMGTNFRSTWAGPTRRASPNTFPYTTIPFSARSKLCS